MNIQIIWSNQSTDFLKKIENKDSQRIISKINSIADNPYHYLESLVNINNLKLRIGKYRAMIEIDKKNKSINILYMGFRKNIYRYAWKENRKHK